MLIKTENKGSFYNGENVIRTNEKIATLHAFQACLENPGLIKQYLFNMVTSKIRLDYDHSKSKLLTQICSQIVVGFSYKKTFSDQGFGLLW